VLTAVYRLLFLAVLVPALLGPGGSALAQTPTDVIGMHDLSPHGTSPIEGTLGGSCLYCHAPHGGLNGTPGVAPTPLWDQKLSSVQSYTLYSSGTMANTTIGALPLGTNSTLCLSCHDGTVAGSPGALVPYGNVPMSGNWYSGDVLGTNLSTMHPINFSLPLQPAADLVASLTANPPSTADQTGAVRLINGNVECGSCHNPHRQNIDPGGYFLVINNTSGALCTACHSTVPTGSTTGMGLTSPSLAGQNLLRAANPHAGSSAATKINPLGGWPTSIHATASNRVPSQATLETTTTTSKASAANKAQATLGSYGTVARNACSSCHAEHNAQGTHALLRAADDQACLVCHNGSSNVSPVTANVLAEMVAPKYGHAFSVGNSPHLPQEAALLNQNMHVTCVDCHNAHAANRVATFSAPPAIRPSQAQVMGISATDGKTAINLASNQYENCLRCHGSSTGKLAGAIYGYLPVWAVSANDPLNVIPQFITFATSSHPVFRDCTSPYPQPSLRANMLQLDGITPGRNMGTRILCTDCHNSDDNREFGGSGPSGPHGSIFSHILERRYEFAQAGAPGRAITNLFPNPSLSAQGGASGGPYALCAKCHELTQILNNTSFSEHARHIKQDGFPCSACHTGHGMGAQSGNISGERLVNFDIRVVAPNGALPISYNRASNSCSLVCHNHAHQLRTAARAAKR
jgi:predicted CXXCH cytochrome family protein